MTIKAWLQGVVEESNSTCPQMQRFVRLFALRSPKSMHSKALRNDSLNSNSLKKTSFNSDSLSTSNHSNGSGGSYERSHSNDSGNNGIVVGDLNQFMRSQSAHGTNHRSSGSVCSDTDSNMSDLSDMSDNQLQVYIGGGPTTSSNIHLNPDASMDLVSLAEDKPKTFTTPCKPNGRIPSPVNQNT